MIIDIFSHLISSSVAQLAEKGESYEDGTRAPPQNEDPEIRLALMDKYSIDIQTLSLTAPILFGFNADDVAELCRRSNNDNYALCNSYPDRFVNICIVSLLDINSAMKELDRSINELDCRGVTIESN